jgi:hypothetical protein
MDLLPLHTFLRTKKEANQLTALFEKIEDALFKENFSLGTTLSKNTSYDQAEQIKKVLRDSNINMESKDELREALKSLRKQLTALPIIHLILAFSPNDEIVDMIHDWFYNNYKKMVLLDISIDKSIIGGSVISFNGRANDYSLGAKIEQLSI